MKLDVYGKELEVIREQDIYIPSEYDQDQVIQYLEDLFHERATPERPCIRILE